MHRARETDYGMKCLVSLPSLRSVCLPDVTVNDLLDRVRMNEGKRTRYHWAASYMHNHSIILMDKYGHIIEPDLLKEPPPRSEPEEDIHHGPEEFESSGYDSSDQSSRNEEDSEADSDVARVSWDNESRLVGKYLPSLSMIL
jgi:hypothetical protein